MPNSTFPSIFADRAVSVALRNNTIRIVFGLERSTEDVEERVEVILPISTAGGTLDSVAKAIRELKATARPAANTTAEGRVEGID